MQADLTSDFARYRFLLDLMEGNTDWEQANTIMAVYQGYAAEGEEEEGGRPGVRRGWSAAFPGATPPDLSSAEGWVEALQADFPDDPDLLDGLEVIVETVYGGEAKRVRAKARVGGFGCRNHSRGLIYQLVVLAFPLPAACRACVFYGPRAAILRCFSERVWWGLLASGT